MSRKAGAIAIIVIVSCFLGVGVYRPFASRVDAPTMSEFASLVDLEPLQRIALQDRGRLKSFDTHARQTMQMITGPREIHNQPPAYTYLDLMLRSSAYDDADIIYVKKKPVRQRIAQVLAADPNLPQERLNRFLKKGLISQDLLMRPEVEQLLRTLHADLLRTSKAVDAIFMALNARHQQNLLGTLVIVPPPGDDPDMRWVPIQTIWQGAAPSDAVHGGVGGGMLLPGLDMDLQRRVGQAWTRLTSSWQQQTPEAAATASSALQELAEMLPELNPTLYPLQDKLSWESWYMRKQGLVWTWMIYILAVACLLIAIIYNWPKARALGLGIFLAAFSLHTFSIGLRWYLSGRIPNSNMFEAIIAATWFGCVAAILFEVFLRRTPMRNLFALGTSVCAVVAMMCSHFMPVTLDRSIHHVMPVLNDVWLYIHTNVIIFSYILIGMAAVVAMCYIVLRLLGGDKEYARAGGAGELILASGPGKSFLKAPRPSFGAVLDGVTMVLMELSFVLLWAGIVMGAVWADHSWGRPWGWDPKEVFALNTFIIFLLLVHVRLKVRDKALWTAVLACLGCGVMLFNWIAINFVIAGLHSYA